MNRNFDYLWEIVNSGATPEEDMEYKIIEI